MSGTLEELLEEADIVIDATPGDTGEEYKKLYQKHGVKAIWQGGEDHELTGFSFNSEANYRRHWDVISQGWFHAIPPVLSGYYILLILHSGSRKQELH